MRCLGSQCELRRQREEKTVGICISAGCTGVGLQGSVFVRGSFDGMSGNGTDVLWCSFYLFLTPEKEYVMIKTGTKFPEGRLGRFYEERIAEKT